MNYITASSHLDRKHRSSGRSRIVVRAVLIEELVEVAGSHLVSYLNVGQDKTYSVKYQELY